MFGGPRRNDGVIFYENRNLLDEQLNPHKHVKADRKYEDVTVDSQVLGVPVTIWNQAHKDLGRLTKFQINGMKYFDAKNSLTPSAGEIFDVILTAMDGSPMQATGIINLMQQNVMSCSYDKAAIAKKYFKNGYVALGQKNICKTLEVRKDTFKLKQEQLYHTRKMENMENPKYYRFFKIQTVIRGSRKDLEEGNGSQLRFKTVWTKEQKSRSVALKAKYMTTGKGVNADRETHLG